MESLRTILKTSSENVTQVKIIPGFIDDVAIECLVRVGLDYGTLHVVRKVCKKWRELFSDDDDGILVMRRARDLQQPSMFLIPCEYPSSLSGKSELACATYKSNILILGGREGDEKALHDVWIINTLKRQVRRENDMMKDREFCGAAAVGDSLFAIGGESFDGRTYDPLATVERYDFAEKKWDYVSSLPYPTMPDRCCVDTFSSSTTKLFVSGLSYDENHDEMYGAYSYCTSYDNWTEVDVTSCQSPVLPRSLKWMWCTGTILFRKTVTSYREGGDDVVSDEAAAAWQFPSEITIPLIVSTALIQPTNGSYEDKTPLISESLTDRSIFLSEEESQTGSAFMSLTVVPNNAEFYPSSVISRVESTSMVAHMVPMNAMKDDMFFPEPIQGPTHKRRFSCLFAVLFF